MEADHDRARGEEGETHRRRVALKETTGAKAGERQGKSHQLHGGIAQPRGMKVAGRGRSGGDKGDPRHRRPALQLITGARENGMGTLTHRKDAGGIDCGHVKD